MILVVGATGLLGSEVCRQLREKGHPVRAMVRAGSSREADLARLGVNVVRGDLKEPASLGHACRGASAVVTTASSTISRRRGDGLRSVDLYGQLALVESARRAGVSSYVFTSVSPNIPPGSVLVRHKRRVEDAVRAAGMAWTILQPSAFMEVWFSPHVGRDPSAGKFVIYGTGTRRWSYISIPDVAHFTVLALERPELRGRDLPLGGPEPVSQLEAARLFEEAAGRRLRLTRIPEPAMRVLSAGLRPFDPVRSALMRMTADMAARGDEIDMGPLLRAFPVRLTSVRDYARRAAWALPGRRAS